MMNSDNNADDGRQEDALRTALIFSASDTGITVGEGFIGGLRPGVHLVGDFDVVPDAPTASWHDRLVHLCTAFNKLVESAVDCNEYSDVVQYLNAMFIQNASDHQYLRKAVLNASARGLRSNPLVLAFPDGVLTAIDDGEVGTAQRQVDASGGETLSMVLIKTHDEAKEVLVVILGGMLAEYLKTGEEKQNVDAPDEEPRQALALDFKVTIDVLPKSEESDRIVYSATIMADVELVAGELLAKFCEAQNWPEQRTLEHFLESPILNEDTLQQVATIDDSRNDVVRQVHRIQPTQSVYEQRRVSSDQEQHAALLFEVRLNGSVADLDRDPPAADLHVVGSPGPANTQRVWPKQKEVAQRLFDKTKEVLDKDKRCFSDFKGVEFMVLTPAFQTLQQQTINRLVGCGVLSEDKVASEYVIMYTRSAKHDQLFSRFKNRVHKYRDILFVVVADECHYGCTAGGAHDHYVNDQDLHRPDSSNLVLLGVRFEACGMNRHLYGTRD